MDGLIINDTNLGFKTINGKRVVTFKEIDEVHGRPEGTARDRFNDHRERFILGEDYYIIKPADLENSQLSEIHPIENDKGKLVIYGIDKVSLRGTIFLTETGYLMIAKVFNDDLSWDVQRRLVDSYFKAQELALTMKDLLALKEELTTMLEEKSSALESRLNNIDGGETVPGVWQQKWVDQAFEKIKKLSERCADGDYKRCITMIVNRIEQHGHPFAVYSNLFHERYPNSKQYRLRVIAEFDELRDAFEFAYDEEYRFWFDTSSYDEDEEGVAMDLWTGEWL